MARNQLFYVELNKISTFGDYFLFHNQSEDILIVKLILLLEDIDKGFDHVIYITRHITHANN